MFGLSNGLLLGGLLAVAASGAGGYYIGYGAGKDAVQTDWDAQKLLDKDETIRLQDRVIELQLNNSEIRDRVVTEYVDRVNTIVETKWQNRDVIKEVFRESPYLSKGWVYAHNQLVSGSPIDPTIASDRTSSTFTEEDSLETINENYSIARQAVAQSQGWKDFYAGVSINYSLPAGDSVQGNSNSREGNSASTVGPN